MTENKENFAEQIREVKKELRAQIGDYKKLFTEIEAHTKAEIERIKQESANGSAVPSIEFQDLDQPGAADIKRVKRAGCAIIRNTFPREQVIEQNEMLGHYITDNGYYKVKIDPKKDQYFGELQSSRPQIFGIYWSPTQIWARQHPHLAKARSFMNRLWITESEGHKHFDPDRECTYADRVRRREPKSASLGLSPHVDAGSVERWLDENYRKVYRHIFDNNFNQYNPFDGAYRTQVKEIPSPAVASVFRTFQGWTALTEQGPGDGTLMLVPTTAAMPYMLLRALQDDVPEDDLCGALPRRAMVINEQWHQLLLEGLVPIPKVYPGDTVWWHPDTIHAVEEEHSGEGYSNVIYIGAAPYCEKNAAFLPKQAEAFLAGKSSPDFADEDYEITYPNRAKLEDLTDLGKLQMGL